MTDPVLEGTQVRLRPMRSDDAHGPYLGWMNDPEVTRYLESRSRPYTALDLLDYIAQTLANPANHFFAIELREGGRHVGNIKLGPVEALHGRGDIGIIIGDRTVWGRGIGTEAVTIISEWAFIELRLRKLTAGAYSSNKGSITAFERAGFHVEAIRPAHYMSDDGIVDAVLMARFATDR